jgi:hypothetical protein
MRRVTRDLPRRPGSSLHTFELWVDRRCCYEEVGRIPDRFVVTLVRILVGSRLGNARYGTAADDVRTLEKLEASLKKRCQPTCPPETEMALSLTREQQLEMFEAVATTTAGQIALAPVTAPYMRLQLSRIRQENVKHAKP